jgi:hypothetical protein
LLQAVVPIATCGGRLCSGDCFCSGDSVFSDSDVLSDDALFAASGGALCYKRHALLKEVNSVASFCGDDVFSSDDTFSGKG